MKRLTRQEVRQAIGFQSPPRPPIVEALTLSGDYPPGGQALRDRYPDDVISTNITVSYWDAPADDPDYRFAMRGMVRDPGLSRDNCPVIADWSRLPEFLDQFPGCFYQPSFDRVAALRRQYPDAYIKVSFGHYLFWRLAELRGLRNFLLDIYDHPRELRLVMDRLLEMYGMWAGKMREAGADGVHGGEDIGSQRALFCRPDQFRRIFREPYAILGDILHENGLEYWLHSCGNITEIMDDLIDAGVDVIHPIQVGAMDAEAIVMRYGGRVCFHVGMDVQHLIPSETPDVIEREIKKRMRLFYRPEGGVVYGAGNVLTKDVPLENIEAYARAMEEFNKEVAIDG